MIYEIIDPSYHSFIKVVDDKLIWESGFGIDLNLSELKFEKKILEHSVIQSHYETDIVDVIKTNQ